MEEIRIGHWAKLGAAVRGARRARSLTQAQLAEHAGVSRSWLAKLESGHRGAELEQILLILSALGLTLSIRDDQPEVSEPPAMPAAAAVRLLERHKSAREARRSTWDRAASEVSRANSG